MEWRHESWAAGEEATLAEPELAEVLEYREDHAIILEQAAGTKALLTLPLMRPREVIDQPTTQILFFTLAAKLNKQVKIHMLDLRRAGDLIFYQKVCLIGRDYDTIFDALDANRSNRTYDVGITLDMHIEFLPGDVRGRLELRGAGVGFA